MGGGCCCRGFGFGRAGGARSLHDDKRTPVTIYQIIDDATRFDVSTCAYAAHENSTDATDAVRKAIATFGSPHELLSDNGAAFNQLRTGVVGPLETYLASVGCLSISGRPRNPQTQGKDERSHRTLFRFLEAHKPKTLKQCEVLTLYSLRSWYWGCA